MEISFLLSPCAYTQLKWNFKIWKNILKVADFHMFIVLLNRNLSKGFHLINILGRFGTGVPIAPVLCFKLAVNRQSVFRRWNASKNLNSFKILKIAQKSHRNNPRLKFWSQMEISFRLWHGGHTQPKWKSNMKETLQMWQILIKRRFYWQEISPNRLTS